MIKKKTITENTFYSVILWLRFDSFVCQSLTQYVHKSHATNRDEMSTRLSSSRQSSLKDL